LAGREKQMGIHVTNRRNVSDDNANRGNDVVEYVVDTVADIIKLPGADEIAIGSTAFVIETNGNYMLGENGWRAISMGQGSGQAPGTPGVGVPAGGTTGQVLSKKSNDDYDTEWKDISADVQSISNTEIQSILNNL
jgi:hypothetical protein